MSGFKGHIRYGWFSHIIGTIIILPISIIILNIPVNLSIGLIGLALPISLFGSILPDIDHPSSRTYRLFRYLLLCSTIIFVSIILGPQQILIKDIMLRFISEVPSEIISITIGLFSLMIGILVTYLFERIRPPHRGITHSMSFGFIVSAIVCLILWQSYIILISNEYSMISAGIISFYLFAGFCSHLYADDMLL